MRRWAKSSGTSVLGLSLIRNWRIAAGSNALLAINFLREGYLLGRHGCYCEEQNIAEFSMGDGP